MSTSLHWKLLLVTTVDWIRVADKYLFSICFIISSGGEVILENTLVVLNTQEVYQMSQNLLLNENTYFMYCTKTGIVASIGGHSVHYPVETNRCRYEFTVDGAGPRRARPTSRVLANYGTNNRSKTGAIN